MSRRATTLIGGVLMVTLAGGCGLPIPRQEPRTVGPAGNGLKALRGAELPQEGCAILPDSLRDQLVPSAKVEKSTQKPFKNYSLELECSIETERDRSTTTATARLRVRIERQLGEFGRDAAVDTARRQFTTDRNSHAAAVQQLPGVGDDAFVVLKAYSKESKRYEVNLGVLHGVENITIRYEAQPTTEDKARGAAKDLATYLVAFLARKQPAPPSVAPFDAPQPKLPKPTLKSDVPAVKIVGPTWQPSEQTFTMDLNDFPFAFRSPMSWNCFRDSKSPTGEGTSWTCGAPKSESPGPARMKILVRACPAGCPADARARLADDWLSSKPAWTTFDATTAWAQNSAGGKYNLVLSHVFGDRPGAAIQWHVGVQGQCSPDDRKQVEALQKVLNDIRSQTP
ncbi:hypothetical protein GCM10010399_65330 [Dactylosporangium fulvum]|uniref:DUF3558 domain-containing protein n=1 Tax=Dactylosporangium fulvum TaxID=53359 RepID=A0ABY5W1C1_9ACTN|nr:hypothetical protein [Dactylosporangium fulvum]UWP82906.1 hypothetical protein Dfulv_00910 [Dactylosporangium fulvum]